MSQKKLYAFIRQDRLETGIRPGGWIPTQRVVPAFDPELKPIEVVRGAFGQEDGRVLVQIVGEAVDWFEERCTGPENKFQGIYACERAIPAEYIQKVDWTK